MIHAEPNQVDTTTERGWDSRPVGDLIDHILQRFHEPLRRDLPALIAAALAVEEEAVAAGCPRGLAAHLEQVQIGVESHLQKEEMILFPLICAGRGSHAFMPVKVMMAEHEDHGRNLQRTRALTRDFALPDGASPTWRALYADLQRLEADLRHHIRLENEVLFPRALSETNETERIEP